MYFGDHVPPHFHALYAEFEALIDIQTFEVIRGDLPTRAMALVRNGRSNTATNSERIGNYVYRIKPLRRFSLCLDRSDRAPVALAGHCG
jgi:hypothetical protein